MTWGRRRNDRDSDEGKIIQGRIKSVWPDLPTRVLTRLEINLPDGVDPIPWVASLTDEEFAAFRMIGKGTLAEFRRSVPMPDHARAERAILDRAEAYRLVEEARDQRERVEEVDRRLTAEVERLKVENERLREALTDMALTWHRGIVHMSDPPFTLEACKYERCRTADTLIGKPV